MTQRQDPFTTLIIPHDPNDGPLHLGPNAMLTRLDMCSTGADGSFTRPDVFAAGADGGFPRSDAFAPSADARFPRSDAFTAETWWCETWVGIELGRAHL